MQTAPVQSPSPRVLIVDDDAALTLMMRTALESAGFVVADAADGVAAIAEFHEFKPDLVLLDIEMPELDGVSACARIRSEAGNHNLPIVMVTSADDGPSIDRAFAAGATDFICKPINWPLFHHRVKGYLAAGQTSLELEASYRRMGALGDAAPDLTLVVGRDGRILEQMGRRVADAELAVPGHSGSLRDLWPDDVVKQMRQRISRAHKDRQPAELDFMLEDDQGVRHFRMRFLPQGPERSLLVVRETTADKAVQAEVLRQSFHDPVTGLPNRHLFEQSATARIAQARLRERGLALLCLSFETPGGQPVDHKVPDAGDLFRDIATRLVVTVRETDPVARLDRAIDEPEVARLSDNLFGVLLSDVHLHEFARSAAMRIFTAFRDSVGSGSAHARVAPRIGIAMFPQDGQDIATLLEAASSAVHEARVTVDEGAHFYSEPPAGLIPANQDLRDELRQAIHREQLQLYYQPRIDIATGELVAVEALLRWHHPLRGFVPLDELLPLADSTGLLMPIGDWVLETACAQARQWQAAVVQANRISINLSRREFAQRDLVAKIAEVLTRSGLEPRCLEVEITESALIGRENAAADLHRLQDLGVGVVLDDFGTGHTSLARLKEFPVNALKIDQSFTSGIPADDRDKAICEVIIIMAHKLGLRAIAEGVETPEQQAFLQNHDCDEMQGFLISEPLPAEAFEAFARSFAEDS